MKTKLLTEAFSSQLSLSETRVSVEWHQLFEIDELFNSILSFLPLPCILIQLNLVCHQWYEKINREDDIHSLWPYLYDTIWNYISEDLLPTNQVYICNKSIDFGHSAARYLDDPNHSLSSEDIQLREEFKNNLLKQLRIYLGSNNNNCQTKLRSSRQVSLIISNYIFAISKCSLLVDDDKKSTFAEPYWIRGVSKGNEFSVSIPRFLLVDLRIAQKSGACCDWSEITCSNWFYSKSDSELKMNSVLLSKRKGYCWPIIHAENCQKMGGRKSAVAASSPIDQRKEWNFLTTSKKKSMNDMNSSRLDSNNIDEESNSSNDSSSGSSSSSGGDISGSSSGSSNEEKEMIITDIWKKVKMKRASQSLISTFDHRFKVMWIQPKFLKQSNPNYLEIPQPLEPIPKRNFKILNHVVSRWIYELERYNLLSVEFILFNTMRVLYYLYNGRVEESASGNDDDGMEQHTLLLGSPLLIENTLYRHTLKKLRAWKNSNDRKNFKNYYTSIFLNTGKGRKKSIYCLSLCCESSTMSTNNIVSSHDSSMVLAENENGPFYFEFSEYQL